MKKQIIFISILLILINILFSQYGQKSKNYSGGKITGVVLDSLSQKPIEYASISIINQKNDLVETGGVTDIDGYFNIDNINPGIYSLKIEYMGYQPIIITDKSISPRKRIFKQEIGEIFLSPSSLQMEAVNVIEDRPIFEFEADKMIYNSSDDIVAGSGTAEDVLNKVPMVTVDQDGEVSLRGNPNVKIMINGRPNRSDGDVDNIPASLIDKVEIITSPSAKYDPEGMAGIINIVLKKGKYEGLNGSIKFNMKHNKFNSIKDMNGFTFYSNYKTDEYNLYSSYSINNRMRTMNGWRRVYNLIENVKEYDINSYDYNFDTDGDKFGQSFKIGSDYSINKNLNLNSEILYKNNYGTKENSQKYFIDGMNFFDENNLKIETSSEQENKNNYHAEIYTELIKTYENPDKEISFSFTYDKGKDSEYEKFILDTTFIDQMKQSNEFDFNLKLPINEKSKLELGYDGRFKNSQENMNFKLSESNNYWIFSGKNEFDFKRSIHGFFTEYQLKLNEKFSLKPSMRIEFVDKNINFKKLGHSIVNSTGLTVNASESIYAQLLEETPDSTINISETNFFPDFHLTYNLTNKKSIQLGISKRIERPGGRGHGKGFGQMRPFPRNIYNDSFIMIGNPFLLPEFSTQYEISFKSPMPMGFYYTNFYYRQITNSIEWYDYDGLSDSLAGNAVTFRNAEGGVDYGIEVFMMIMGQTIGGSYNLNELNDSSNDFQLNGKNERANMYMRINLPEEYIKLFGFEFGFYYMKLKVPGGTLFGSKGTLWANTGISKSLFDDRASISFSIDNILDKGGFQMFREKPLININGEIYGQEVTDIYASRGGRTFSLSFKYNFGKMQEEKRKRRGGYGSGGDSMDMGY